MIFLSIVPASAGGGGCLTGEGECTDVGEGGRRQTPMGSNLFLRYIVEHISFQRRRVSVVANIADSVRELQLYVGLLMETNVSFRNGLRADGRWGESRFFVGELYSCGALIRSTIEQHRRDDLLASSTAAAAASSTTTNHSLNNMSPKEKGDDSRLFPYLISGLEPEFKRPLPLILIHAVGYDDPHLSHGALNGRWRRRPWDGCSADVDDAADSLAGENHGDENELIQSELIWLSVARRIDV